MEGAGDGWASAAVHEVTVQAADPIFEVGAAAHALCVCEEGEGRGAVGEAGRFDIYYFLAGGNDGGCDVWEAHGVYCWRWSVSTSW